MYHLRAAVKRCIYYSSVLLRTGILCGDTQSAKQDLTLLSESGPGSVSRALSEGALAFRTLG